MEKRERAVCGTLCLCLAVAVMSAVALVYLTVIIYMPTQRELTSGINEVPVMCTTTERKQIKAKCLIERECIRCVGLNQARLDTIFFSSNHNIYKRLCDLCF